MNSAYQAIIPAPGFALGVVCDSDWLIEIVYLPAQAEQAAREPLAMETGRQLRAYLENPDFSFNLPLQPAGTPFQRRVWAEISTIPCGETRSYGELAKQLHNAPRAVGQACGRNPYPLIVPCHRVVAARQGLNHGLGGFARSGGGFLLDIKRWLLGHETSLGTQAPVHA